MNALRHEQTTMTPAEAEAIVARVMARPDVASNGPSVSAVAEALRLPPDEIARMLAELRAQPPKRLRRQTNRRERRVWMLGGVAALTLGTVALGWLPSFRVGPWNHIHGEHALIVEPVIATRAAPAVEAATSPAVSGDHVFRVFIDGNDTGSGLAVNLPDGDADAFPNALETWMASNAYRFHTDAVATSGDEAARDRSAASEGRWKDVAGITMRRLDLRRPDDAGRLMRWAWATVPIYGGDDALIADVVATERRRAIAKAVVVAKRGLSAPATKAEDAVRQTG